MNWLTTLFMFILFNPVVWIVIILAVYANKKASQTNIQFETLGDALRYYREKRHFSQEFVAQQLNVSRQAVSKWENNLSEPSTNNLIALAKLYKVSVETLVSTK